MGNRGDGNGPSRVQVCLDCEAPTAEPQRPSVAVDANKELQRLRADVISMRMDRVEDNKTFARLASERDEAKSELARITARLAAVNEDNGKLSAMVEEYRYQEIEKRKLMRRALTIVNVDSQLAADIRELLERPAP